MPGQAVSKPPQEGAAPILSADPFDLRALPQFPSVGSPVTFDETLHARAKSLVARVLESTPNGSLYDVLPTLSSEFAAAGDLEGAKAVAQVLATLRKRTVDGREYIEFAPGLEPAPWNPKIEIMSFFVAQRALADRYGILANPSGANQRDMVRPLVVASEAVDFKSANGFAYRVFIHDTETPERFYGCCFQGGTTSINRQNCRRGQLGEADRTRPTIANEFAHAWLQNELSCFPNGYVPGGPITIVPPERLSAEAKKSVQDLRFDKSALLVHELVSDAWSVRIDPLLETQRLAEVYLFLTTLQDAQKEIQQAAGMEPGGAKASSPYELTRAIVGAAITSSIGKHDQLPELQTMLSRLTEMQQAVLKAEAASTGGPPSKQLQEAYRARFDELQTSSKRLVELLGTEGRAELQSALVYYGDAVTAQVEKRLESIILQKGLRMPPVPPPARPN